MVVSTHLGEMLGRYLSEPQRKLFARLGDYKWFSPENEQIFRQALEPLANAVTLGLERQVQNYFTHIADTFSYDLFLKAAYLVHTHISGNGSVLSGSNIKIIRVDDLDTLLPNAAFAAIEQLSEEGFSIQDFGIASTDNSNNLTLVLWICNKWLKVTSWKLKTKDRNWSW